MTKPVVPSGTLKKVEHDFELEGGWLKMPIDAIMFNSRLTGQAKKLWTWLASLEYRSYDMSWHQCEFKLNCGTTARRRCLLQLREEGFISVSEDGTVITMHDPVVVYENTRRLQVEHICKECADLTGEQIPLKIVTETIVEKPADATKNTANPLIEKRIIADAWNAHKPDSYSKIRAVSGKQKQAVEKHLKNLGLAKDDMNEFISLVCRGLSQSNFWMNTVNSKVKNFNAVFGYGSPTDTKMRSVEQLYNDGQNCEDIKTTVKSYTPEQQELIDEIQVHDYEIDMSFNDQERRERSMKARERAIKKLKTLGIDLEVN